MIPFVLPSVLAIAEEVSLDTTELMMQTVLDSIINIRGIQINLFRLKPILSQILHNFFL